ncbi:MAG: response regulator transcription factor [Chloroflexi bacterium]|nr:response regulator transcription factor [Chloroflexota bacterium]
MTAEHRKILAVDDDKKIVGIVKAYLEKEGYLVSVAFDGKTALEMAASQSPDLIILDLMLPEVAGWDVCRLLRAKSNVPIIMLTARDEDTDKIVGLELGADDYITKPFNPKEMVSRVRAVLRRSQMSAEKRNRLELGDLSVDLEKREVRSCGRLVELTATEFELLSALAERPGRVYSRLQLLDIVQGYAYEGYERTIDSHVKNLRKKLEPDPDHPRYVITVRGVGYKLAESANA